MQFRVINNPRNFQKNDRSCADNPPVRCGCRFGVFELTTIGAAPYAPNDGSEGGDSSGCDPRGDDGKWAKRSAGWEDIFPSTLES